MKRWLATIAALLVFASARASAADEVRRVAVVVGANGAAPGRKPLRFAYEDAARIGDVLRLAGFASADIHLMKDPAPEAVLAELDKVLRDTSGKPSQLVFYYSGHADTMSLYPRGEALSLTSLRERLDSAKATVRIGIIDACRGGGWTGMKGLTPTEPFQVELPLMLSNEGSVLISASSGLEDAHESENLRGSFFTHYWVVGLRGAGDRDGDGTITLAEAFAYANEMTVRDTALQTKNPQHPSFQLNLRGKQDLPLVTLAAANSILTLDQKAGPVQLVHLDSGVVVLELPRGKRQMRLALPPGKYLLRRETDGKTFAREVSVTAGKQTRVDEEELTLVGTTQLAVKGSIDNSRFLLGLGLGAGGLTGMGMESLSSGVTMTLQIGYRIRPQLHLLLNSELVSFARYTPDRDFSQSQDAVTLGARWEMGRTFYLKGGVGVATLIRQRYDSLLSVDERKWGGAVTAGFGTNLFATDRFSVAIETTDSIGIYDSGYRHNFGFNFALQLWR